jgi:hypothetical protein
MAQPSKVCVRPDEDVVAEYDGLLGARHRGGPQYRVLADHGGLADFDAGALGVQHRAVHHPDARPDQHVQGGHP